MIAARGGIGHPRRVRVIPSLVFILSLVSGCDPDDEPTAARSGEVGCAYDAPLNYNDDHANTPAECAMKMALCVDAFVIGCDEDGPACYAEIGHCLKSLDVCWKTIE